jgi:hypothetical protein
MLSSRRLFRLAFLATLVSLFWAGPAPADDFREPYRLRIVLHLAPHRLLTDVFHRQLERELKDGLQAALGKLARVEVVRKHPRLNDVLARGLGRSLDDYRERSDAKTHFVLIDFAGTRYEITARQHDGLTGLPSPAVRRERTRDRAYVARAAALLIEHDLGLLGTVVSEPDAAGRVKVELKGGGLGVDLGRWVKKDEVMGLVRVNGDAAGSAVPWTFLQVEAAPASGVCTCRAFRRYPQMQVQGMRCVLLGTRSGTMRLRVVQETPGGGYTEMRSSVRLQIRRRGFEGEDGTLLQLAAPGPGNRDVDTADKGDKGKFSRMAFISVLAGQQRKARIPVALVDDQVVLLPVPAVNEENTLALERYRLLGRSVLMSYSVQSDLFREINDLTAKPAERARALARVRETLKRSRDDHARLSKERDEVEKELDRARLQPGEKPSFEAIDRRLRQIRSGEADLEQHIALLEKIEKEENDPARKEAKIKLEQARLLVKEAEVGKALALYKQVPDKFRPKGLDRHIADLEKQWQTKSEAHRDARDFIYRLWPDLSTPGMVERFGEAEKAFETCKQESDTVAPLKLLKTNDKHRQRLEKELAALNPRVNIDHEKPTKEIGELLPKLLKLDTAIRAYLSRKAGD